MAGQQHSPEFELVNRIGFAIINNKSTARSGQVLKSGFFISCDGWALTTWHGGARGDGDELVVRYNNEEKRATIDRASREHDVAAIRVADVALEDCVPLSSEWGLGDRVLVGGYQAAEYVADMLPLDHRLDGNQRLWQVRFPEGVERQCMALQPSSGGPSILRRTSGGPILHRDQKRLIGVVIGGPGEKVFRMEDGQLRGVADELRYGWGAPIELLFPDWKEFQALFKYGLKTMEEASRFVAEPTPVTVRVADPETFLPIPPQHQVVCEMQTTLVSNVRYMRFVQEADAGYWKPDGACTADGKVDAGYLAHWKNARSEDELPSEIREKPVVNVSPLAAQAYAKWCGERSGRRGRLPTEAEWERAAWCGRNPQRAIEEDIERGRVNCGRSGLLPVNREVNPWGVADLLGNARDLCTVGGATPESDDEDNDEDDYVGRGGCFHEDPGSLMNSVSIDKNECLEDISFRCVFDLIRRS